MRKFVAPTLVTAAFALIMIVAVRTQPVHWYSYAGFAVLVVIAGVAWWRAATA